MDVNVSQSRVNARAILGFALMLIFFSALPFLAAGTLRWPAAWLFVIVYVTGATGSRYVVAQRRPDLLAERSHVTSRAGIKPWDKVLAPLVSLGGSFVLLVVAGLDYRFAWSPPLPSWTMLPALGVILLVYIFSTWAMVENRFFSAVVRIQAERGHEVVSGGPYRYIRHPGYASALVCYFAIAIALGSLWALVPAAITSVLLVARTALEDRTLRAELPGYAAYAERVRWRLLPGVW